MRLFDYFRSSALEQADLRPPMEISRLEPVLEQTLAPRAEPQGGLVFNGLNDPAFLEYVRGSQAAGGPGALKALRNMAVLRCVTLISEAIGMLPFNLMYSDPGKGNATDHPAFRLLKYRPNSWQTPLEFKRLMEFHLMFKGNAYARVIKSGSRPVALIPMHPDRVEPQLSSTWEMTYVFTRPDGQRVVLPASEVFHLRDLSEDGIKGQSRVRLAGGAIDLALKAEQAASRTFESGVMAGGALEFPHELSDRAYDRIKNSLRDEHSGAENSGKFMILEGGGKAGKFSDTASAAQHIENRGMQIEEVARAFGVPRPLMMMDDTAWGSGIEQLAIFFVQYALAFRFTNWEQSAARVLLTESELDQMQFKFNERALLRGTLEAQANFFTKALGAGGQAPWMTQNEVRKLSDLPESDEPQANSLKNQMSKAPNNEPPKAP